MENEEEYTIKHFSLSMPKGEQQSSVPALLRRLAEAVEAKGEIEIMDITFTMELDKNGDD